MQKSDVQLFIGGEWRKTANTLPIINPADESEIGRVSVAEREDLESALQAAWSGYQAWRNFGPSARAAIIMKAAALMRERQEEIARSITVENGKPLAEAHLRLFAAANFSNGMLENAFVFMVALSRVRLAFVILYCTSRSVQSQLSRPGIFQ